MSDTYVLDFDLYSISETVVRTKRWGIVHFSMGHLNIS